MNCAICAERSFAWARAVVLENHTAEYFRCEGCGFIQCVDPFWLEEAYKQAITPSDIGTVHRAFENAYFVEALILLGFRTGMRCLDYGGGYGVFVRHMRDRGYDFHRYDRFCKNLFALDFDADIAADSTFELLTAFEVFEHLVDPGKDIAEMLRIAPNIVFTTMLLPDPAPKPGEWSYYGLHHGQHVSFFTGESLKRLARRFDLHLCSDGIEAHVLSRDKVSPHHFKLARNIAFQRLALPLLRRLKHVRSLLGDDVERAMKVV